MGKPRNIKLYCICIGRGYMFRSRSWVEVCAFMLQEILAGQRITAVWVE